MNAPQRRRPAAAMTAFDAAARTWTRAMVERRLVECELVLADIVRPTFARGRARDVPAAVNYFGEDQVMAWQYDRWEWLKHEGFVSQDGEVLKPIPWRWPIERLPKQSAIDRATEAMSWPIMFVPRTEHRLAVLAWVVHKAFRGRRHGFTQLLSLRLKLLFIPSDVPKQTAHRWKDAGLAEIAAGLNGQRVEVALPGDEKKIDQPH